MMNIKTLLKTLSTTALLVGSTLAFATQTYTIVNQTPYTIEISGLVNASASVNPISVENAKSSIFANGNFIGHVMVLNSQHNAYLENVILRSVDSKFQTFDLYHKIHVSQTGNTITLSGSA